MRRILAIDIGLVTLGLATVFALTARWAWVMVIAMVGLSWLTEFWHGLSWVPTVGFLFFTAAAVVGIILKLPPFWLLSCLVAALVAWDLSHFVGYVDEIIDIGKKTEITKRHYQRLGIAAGSGWFLGALALGVKLSLDFSWALVLGLLITVSLSLAIGRMGRESDQS